MGYKRRLSDKEAVKLGFKVKKKTGKYNPQYYFNNTHIALDTSTNSKSKSNDYKNKAKFVLSAWSEQGHMMDIDEYCSTYHLPKENITSYKLVSHTGTPFYNIVFKESIIEAEVKEIDFESIVKKYVKRIDVDVDTTTATNYDFDVTTFTDTHIGMDTDKDKNSMYAEDWNREMVIALAYSIIKETLQHKKSDILFVDDLGDLLDGLFAQTTRGGHSLPQNMTNEQAFDCAYEFKMILLDGLVGHYNQITFNNVCNDNHSGCFGYFLNQYFKGAAELKYKNVTVTNHRTFLSHYIVGDIGFIISHGKDDKTLKFGFKPHLDTKQIEKIDQYCKHNDLYRQTKRIIFKKGDSHQTLFDMAGSDDFDYYNYPASSPSSQWCQNNYKKGRRGFVLENFKGLENTIIPVFY